MPPETASRLPPPERFALGVYFGGGEGRGGGCWWSVWDGGVV